MAAPGSRSDGLRMRVLPVTVARGIVHRGIMLEYGDQRHGEKRTCVNVRREVEWSNAVDSSASIYDGLVSVELT